MIPRSERYTLLDKQEPISIRKQTELLSIARSGFYYKPKSESLVNLHLMKLMDEQYQRTPFYGFPRMFEYLKQACPTWILNRKRVYRLYIKMELRALLPSPHTSKPDPKANYKFPYLLKDLRIENPNQVWASDITYIPMTHGYMYLYAIIDLFSRFIVNWDLSNSMSADWCATVTQEAFYKYGKPVIFNTDQGAQFTSEVFVNLLKDSSVQFSMDGKGRAIDNIFIERFWRTVKYEYVYLNPANSGYELYKGMQEYMNFYNFERPHETLGYRRPVQLYPTKNNIKISTKYSTSLV